MLKFLSLIQKLFQISNLETQNKQRHHGKPQPKDGAICLRVCFQWNQ